MYDLAVGAMFKNEEKNIKEWLDHYLYHGVQHFYLIDDDSNDSSATIVQPYVDKGVVTIAHEKHDYYLGRQHNLYNKHVLPNINSTLWLLIVDLDELMWSPRSINLCHVLAELDHIAQIQVMHTVFGSNGHIEEPESGLVKSYTKRSISSPTVNPGNYKYFVNSTRAIYSGLGVHSATFVAKPGFDAPYYIMDETYFVLNHYCCQSREFWRKIKCTRGDADNYRVRTMNDFSDYDLNDVEDTRLLEQNINDPGFL